MNHQSRPAKAALEDDPVTDQDHSSAIGSLTEAHRDLLRSSAIDPEHAIARGIRSITEPDQLPEDFNGHRSHVPGILFPWTTPSGQSIPQYRPDDPPLDDRGHPNKYLFPKGSGSNIGVVREEPGSDLVNFIEGTKQATAADQYLPPGSGSIYVIFGCRNWSIGGVPISDLEVVDGKRVRLIFDADLATNHDVWEAAKKFSAALKVEGATSIEYVILPAGKKAGLDDVLAAREPERRQKYLVRLLDQAVNKLPREPKKPRAGTAFFDDTGKLLALELAAAVEQATPLLLTPDQKVAAYKDGVYRLDGLGVLAIVARFLGNDYRPCHLRAVEDVIVGALWEDNLIAPDHLDEPLLNCLNGMVDIRTGLTRPHDPDYKSLIQIPVAYDPAASCPTFTKWLNEVAPAQADDLLEVLAQALDPTSTPDKAALFFGPTKSGKSTLLRILGDLIGEDNTSAVSLHELAGDRFAGADVYGKMLNVYADLSAAEVSDLSLFKLMTGEDRVRAQRKYGHAFSFVNRALFVFSANELPQVSENSRAYFSRVKPFRFGTSFDGRIDPSIEKKIRTEELPGVLNLLVQAWQRRAERGSWLSTPADIQTEFEANSNRVAGWVWETCTVHPTESGTVDEEQWSAPRSLFHAFRSGLVQSGSANMTEKTFIAKLKTVPGVREVTKRGSFQRGVNVTIGRKGDEETVGEDETAASDTSDTSVSAVRTSENRQKEEASHLSPSGQSGEEVSEVSEIERLWNEIPGPATFVTLPPQRAGS